MDPTDRIGIFVSHSTKNRRLAEEIEEILSSAGLTCWIAPRDVPPGGDYAESIVDAISRSDTLVVVLTSDANLSKHVASEVELAVNRGLRIVPLRFAHTKPEGSLEFLLSRKEWVELSPKSMEDDLRRFAESLKETHDGRRPVLPPTRRRRRVRIGIVMGLAALSVAVVAAGVYLKTPAGPDAISFPADGAIVSAQETAQGSSLATRGRTLFAVVLTESPPRYYPQDPQISTGWRGAWRATVYFGEVGGPGGAFDLLLVETVDATPYNQYLEAARASGSWDGLAALPEGSRVLDTVRVARK